MSSITSKIREKYFSTYQELIKMCDEVDKEHERLMKQQANDIRKASCRYFASIIEDYKRGRKRPRNKYALRLGRTSEGLARCSQCDSLIRDGQRYCQDCGAEILG